MGKLADALRRRFKTPQEALKALGLDAALISNEERSMTVQLSPRAAVARGALMFYMRPRLAADAAIDFGPVLAGVTAKNFAAKRPAIIAALKKAVAGKLAADADVEDVEEVLEAIEDMKDDIVEHAEMNQEDMMAPPDDMGGGGNPDNEEHATDSPEMLAKVLEFLKGKLRPEDMNALTEMVGGEQQITESPEDEAKRKAMEENGGGAVDDVVEVPLKKEEVQGAVDTAVKKATAGLMSRTAMDEAIQKAVAETKAQAQAVQEATRAIRPYVGELAMDASLDTADKIYAKALTVLGVPNVDKIHPSAYPALLESQQKLGASRSNPRHAIDAAPAGVKSFAERFPHAAVVQNA